jgi:hypothetical protein
LVIVYLFAEITSIGSASRTSVSLSIPLDSGHDFFLATIESQLLLCPKYFINGFRVWTWQCPPLRSLHVWENSIVYWQSSDNISLLMLPRSLRDFYWEINDCGLWLSRTFLIHNQFASLEHTSSMWTLSMWSQLTDRFCWVFELGYRE